jgi:hypothetical protein
VHLPFSRTVTSTRAAQSGERAAVTSDLRWEKLQSVLRKGVETARFIPTSFRAHMELAWERNRPAVAMGRVGGLAVAAIPDQWSWWRFLVALPTYVTR